VGCSMMFSAKSVESSVPTQLGPLLQQESRAQPQAKLVRRKKTFGCQVPPCLGRRKGVAKTEDTVIHASKLWQIQTSEL